MKIHAKLLLFLFIAASVTSHHIHPLSDEFIDLINSKQSLWRAGRNFDRHTSFKYLKKLAGSIRPNTTINDSFTDEPPQYNTENLPYQFDARKNWEICPSINEVRDQGACGSCWAVSTVSAMSDRLCIQSKGREKIYFSEFDVMSCCLKCGNACNGGGLLGEAWRFATITGVVSGGPYHSRKCCKPYTVPPCKHVHIKHHDFYDIKPCGHIIPSTTCKKVCQDGRLYQNDKRRLAQHYLFKEEKKIMAEIYNNGPVATTFAVFADFFSYKSGVYRFVAGKFVGNHSVKVIGWGEENGVMYWLAANSWNKDWGDKGFFKILRGSNHLGIESVMHSGLFHVKH